MKLQLTL